MKWLRQSLPVRVVMAYGESQASNFASGLAFNGFLALFPLVLGILSVIGLAVRNRATRERFQEALINVFPAEAHDQLAHAISGVSQHAGLLGIVAIGGLLWSGTGFFAAMEFALTQVFGSKQRDMLRQRAMGLVMMLVFLAAVLVAVAANGAGTYLPFMPYTGLLIGLASLVALMAAIYRFVPNRTFHLAEVWPGALLAGTLLEVLTLVFPLYARVSHGFSTYGQQFALFFLLASWLYMLSVLVLLGAVFIRMRLGEPDVLGVVASPMHKARENLPALEVIRKHQAEGEGDAPPPRAEPPAPPARKKASPLRRAPARRTRRT